MAFGLSDVGLVRQNNEDAWGAVPEIGFFAIADGMGGHQAGEVAARECITSLCKIVKKIRSKKKKLSLTETRSSLHKAIEQVNDIIYKLGHANPELKGMGTTLCCMQFHEQGVVFAHIGDSRIYRYFDGKLIQLTTDHSLMRELIDLGQLSEGQAPEFLYKNIITKAMGTEPHIEPSILVSEVTDHDTFLMCTDGLSDLLTPAEIESILSQDLPVVEAAKILVKTAKAKGGFDNITVVLIRLKEINDAQDLSRQ